LFEKNTYICTLITTKTKDMNINLIFTPDEKKKFLVKNGFELVEYNHDVWEQWGNHDSQGKWEVLKYICAIKVGETPSIKNKYDDVFNQIVLNKFKNFLLEL
jgi:hypothetical protein